MEGKTPFFLLCLRMHKMSTRVCEWFSDNCYGSDVSDYQRMYIAKIISTFALLFQSLYYNASCSLICDK
jgi:hypothetical protein